jgi:hypothetical protein
MDGVDNTTWRTASYSGNSGNCVEAAVAEAGRVAVRDTTDREGGTLAFTADVWRAFARDLKRS